MNYFNGILIIIATYLLMKFIGSIWSNVEAINKSKKSGKLHLILSKGAVTLYKEIKELEDTIDYLSVNKLSKAASQYKETLPFWTEYHLALEYLTMLEILQNNLYQEGYKSVDIVMQEDVNSHLKIMEFDEYVNMVCDQKDKLYDQALAFEQEARELDEAWQTLILGDSDED